MEYKEAVCTNCKYFVRYYVKWRAQFIYASAGYCHHHDLARKERKKVPNVQSCPSWESDEIQKAVRREQVEEVLREMRDRLAHIALILREDED